MIVTGAGAGLGRAYSLMYAKLGANIVVNDVSEKGAKAVVDEIVNGWFRMLPNGLDRLLRDCQLVARPQQLCVRSKTLNRL